MSITSTAPAIVHPAYCVADRIHDDGTVDWHLADPVDIDAGDGAYITLILGAFGDGEETRGYSAGVVELCAATVDDEKSVSVYLHPDAARELLVALATLSAFVQDDDAERPLRPLRGS